MDDRDMRFEDYYARLGVARDASIEEIRKAYRKLARKYHPDVSKEPDAEARIKEINEAWAVLGDPEKRAAYDQLGSGWRAGEDFRPPPDWQGGGFGADFGGADFGELFESLFRRHGGAPQGGSRRRRRRAGDQVTRAEISVEEAVTGCERTVRLAGPGGVRTLKVKIPPGATQGSRMRLSGQAEGGPGETPGDVLLEVHLREHPLYRVDGRDLSYALPLAPWEAALGTRLEVPTPTGPVGLTIRPGTQGGQRMRLKGRGLPGRRAGEGPGDLYIEIQLRNPEAASAAVRHAFEQLREVAGFDARAGWSGVQTGRGGG
jgi:curved DNA-binding protein